ncbi:hypothetical protein EMIT0347P_80078 [Pseudomonas sp. IT-347P]
MISSGVKNAPRSLRRAGVSAESIEGTGVNGESWKTACISQTKRLGAESTMEDSSRRGSKPETFQIDTSLSGSPSSSRVCHTPREVCGLSMGRGIDTSQHRIGPHALHGVHAQTASTDSIPPSARVHTISTSPLCSSNLVDCTPLSSLTFTFRLAERYLPRNIGAANAHQYVMGIGENFIVVALRVTVNQERE